MHNAHSAQPYRVVVQIVHVQRCMPAGTAMMTLKDRFGPQTEAKQEADVPTGPKSAKSATAVEEPKRDVSPQAPPTRARTREALDTLGCLSLVEAVYVTFPGAAIGALDVPSRGLKLRNTRALPPIPPIPNTIAWRRALGLPEKFHRSAGWDFELHAVKPFSIWKDSP
jgi:hypothetical protein